MRDQPGADKLDGASYTGKISTTIPEAIYRFVAFYKSKSRQSYIKGFKTTSYGADLSYLNYNRHCLLSSCIFSVHILLIIYMYDVDANVGFKV